MNNARATLMAGFTSVRDVGGSNPAWWSRLKRGGERRCLTPGPPSLGGGHAARPDRRPRRRRQWTRPRVSDHPGWEDNLIDNPEAARKTVRRLRREGVDLIKIMPSGGVMSIGDDPRLQLMDGR